MGKRMTDTKQDIDDYEWEIPTPDQIAIRDVLAIRRGYDYDRYTRLTYPRCESDRDKIEALLARIETLEAALRVALVKIGIDGSEC